jgi:hypothetical protein
VCAEETDCQLLLPSQQLTRWLTAACMPAGCADWQQQTNSTKQPHMHVLTLGHRGIHDLELAIAHGLVAQGPLARPPLEALHHRLPHRRQQALVHLGGQGVVQQDVGAVAIRPKRPDGACRGAGAAKRQGKSVAI